MIDTVFIAFLVLYVITRHVTKRSGEAIKKL